MENYTIEGFENIQYQGIHGLKNIERKLESLYTGVGYHPISIPTFEPYDLYVTETSIPSNDLFKMVDRYGKVLALKPDATLAVGRMAAVSHPDPSDILKFFYLTNIYRNFPASEMVRKELTQMGVEYFGNDSPECDGEIIALAIQTLLSCGVKDAHIDLGHVGYINHLVAELKLELRDNLLLYQLIENKNIGDIKDFLEKKNVHGKIADTLLMIPKLYGEPTDVIGRMDDLCVNDEMRIVVGKLRAIYEHLKTIGYAEYISFDLGFTNSMNYYSDMLFKGYINGWGEAVIHGGRYDNLSSKFGLGRPACGFGVDIINMLTYLEQHDLIEDTRPSKTVILYGADDKSLAYQKAEALRFNNQTVEVFIANGDRLQMTQKLLTNPLYEKADFYYLKGGKFHRWQNGDFAEEVTL